MSTIATGPIVRTERGLSIEGTRITLYSVMDFVKAGWPAGLIRDRLGLTDEQISEAVQYIEVHRDEVEREYQSVLEQAEENRQYWEGRNRERFAEIESTPPEPGQEQIRARLQAAKARWRSTQ